MSRRGDGSINLETCTRERQSLELVTLTFIVAEVHQLRRNANVLSYSLSIALRRENPFGEEQLFLNNTEVLYASHFNESRPTKFIVHGFSDTGNEGWIRDLIDGGWN